MSVLVLFYYLWWVYMVYLIPKLVPEYNRIKCGLPYVGQLLSLSVLVSIGTIACILGIAMNENKIREDFVVCLIAVILPCIFGWMYIMY